MIRTHVMFVVLMLLLGCAWQESYPEIDRESLIPVYAVKMLPEGDKSPPVLHSEDYEKPVLLAYPVKTAGAKDSAFYHDGLYFHSHRAGGKKDTDIWVTKKTCDGWQIINKKLGQPKSGK
jgi:hypothetical protein